MANIRQIDMKFLNEIFEMGSGYVLDFSNNDFFDFFEYELKANIDDQVYSVHGTSKAKRLRQYLQIAKKDDVAKLLASLWEYREDRRGELKQEEHIENANERLKTIIGRLTADVCEEVFPKFHASQKLTTLVRDDLISNLNLLKQIAPQNRGFEFEKFLNKFFNAYDLQPNKPFRNTGEQLDGSFLLSDEIYLLEAKWQNQKTGNADLHIFQGKIDQKAAWTRGVFVSYSGFTKDGLIAFGRGKSIICLDGLDLYKTLDRSLSFGDVIKLKVRHASERGEVFKSVDDLFPE